MAGSLKALKPCGAEIIVTMSQLPKVGRTLFTEREGVIHVANQVNRAMCIWRETPSVDVGIDGQIEHVNSAGEATGHMVFVQVKSGASYFERATNEAVTFTPVTKHRSYWERSALPVILVLHNESTAETVWVDARDALRSGNTAVEVPRCNVFDERGVLEALNANGPLPLEPIPMSELVKIALSRKSPSAGLPLDYLDLFLHGLTNNCNSVYFGMSLVSDVADAKLMHLNSNFGFGMGHAEYQFLQDYVLFLAEQDLARVDFDEFNREWDRELVGQFMAPLTSRGRAFIEFLSSQDDSKGVRAVQDKTFRGIEPFECLRRIPVVEDLKCKIGSLRVQSQLW